MRQDVAMIDEVANVRAAKIHADRYARIRTGARPVRDLNHIMELLLLLRHRHAVDCEQQEMNLVHVKFMDFPGAVLDGPVFHRSLRGCDRRRVVGVKYLRSRSVDGDEEFRVEPEGGVVVVQNSLRKNTACAESSASHPPVPRSVAVPARPNAAGIFSCAVWSVDLGLVRVASGRCGSMSPSGRCRH